MEFIYSFIFTLFNVLIFILLKRGKFDLKILITILFLTSVLFLCQFNFLFNYRHLMDEVFWVLLIFSLLIFAFHFGISLLIKILKVSSSGDNESRNGLIKGFLLLRGYIIYVVITFYQVYTIFTTIKWS